MENRWHRTSHGPAATTPAPSTRTPCGLDSTCCRGTTTEGSSKAMTGRFQLAATNARESTMRVACRAVNAGCLRAASSRAARVASCFSMTTRRRSALARKTKTSGVVWRAASILRARLCWRRISAWDASGWTCGCLDRGCGQDCVAKPCDQTHQGLQ